MNDIIFPIPFKFYNFDFSIKPKCRGQNSVGFGDFAWSLRLKMIKSNRQRLIGTIVVIVTSVETFI